MLVATSYPLLEVFWTMLIFFGFVVWLWILFACIGDLFRRQDASGWVKVAWIAFIIILPYLGVFAYLLAQHGGMTERTLERQQVAQGEAADYVRSMAGTGGATQEIADAKGLLDQGTISEAEFNQIKSKALAA